MKGIKTIATQERFLSLWESDSFFPLDHYLVINQINEKLMLNERFGIVKKIKSIGPIRADSINNEVDQTENVVLILDTHSNKNFYKNGISRFANWRNNHLFYKNILKLSKENLNFKFIIKGKNYAFINISYFKDIKRMIEESKNVELYSNKNNSFSGLIKKTKITIARHTSLNDELLFKKRPVIIYDVAGYPSAYFNYGKNIIVSNYEELEGRFNLWKEDPRKFNENIISDTSRYFPSSMSKKKVYDSLHSYLENEFKYYI